jgi:flavodoxin
MGVEFVNSASPPDHVPATYHLGGFTGRVPGSMTTAIVVYDAWYGLTKVVAEEVARGLSADGRVATVVANLKEVSPAQILEHDIIVFGSPHRPGGVSKGIRAMLQEFRTYDLRDRRLAFFDTCFPRDHGRAVAQMEAILRDRNPFVSPPFLGLSVSIHRPRGPILPGELSKCQGLGRSIRTSLPISV